MQKKQLSGMQDCTASGEGPRAGGWRAHQEKASKFTRKGVKTLKYRRNTSDGGNGAFKQDGARERYEPEWRTSETARSTKADNRNVNKDFLRRGSHHAESQGGIERQKDRHDN